MPPPKCHLLRSNGGIEAGDMHHASPIGRFKSDEERVAVVRTSLSLGPLDDLMNILCPAYVVLERGKDVLVGDLRPKYDVVVVRSGAETVLVLRRIAQADLSRARWGFDLGG